MRKLSKIPKDNTCADCESTNSQNKQHKKSKASNNYLGKHENYKTNYKINVKLIKE